MRKVSIRQPLLLYAVVFMMLLVFAAATLASVDLVRASQLAYRRAVLNQLMMLSVSGAPEVVEQRLTSRTDHSGLELGLVRRGQAAFEVDLVRARKLRDNQTLDQPFVLLPFPTDRGEGYLIARIDPGIPLGIAFRRVSRLIPILILIGIAVSLIFAFMVGRLVVLPLRALETLASDANLDAEVLESSDAPNEVLEIARSFRQTVRALNQERNLIATQRDELELMQAGLVRASKLASVGRLAAGIAHEIGNPLAAVQGYLSLMKSGLDPEQEKDALERSLKELQRIHETIRKLLTYARTDDEEEPPSPFALAPVVTESLALLRGHPALRNVEIRAEELEALFPEALGHSARLRQVLVNLCLNAAHAMQNTDPKVITIETTVNQKSIELRVRDNGPGVPDEKTEQIFDPFFTTKDPGEGTGLGLAISRSILEAMDGDLTLETTAPEGACFVLAIPRASPDVAEKADEGEPVV